VIEVLPFPLSLSGDLKIFLKFFHGSPNKISEEFYPVSGRGSLTIQTRFRKRPDKGKPSERLGRKVTGLSPKEGYGSRITGQDITFAGETAFFHSEMPLRPPSPFYPARVHFPV
jgi:hypothetical protein